MRAILLSKLIIVALLVSACEEPPLVDALEPPSTERTGFLPLLEGEVEGSVHVERVSDFRVVLAYSPDGSRVSHLFALDVNVALPQFESVTVPDAMMYVTTGTVGLYDRTGRDNSFLVTARDPDNVFAVMKHAAVVEDIVGFEREHLMRFPSDSPRYFLSGYSLTQRALPENDPFTFEASRSPGSYAIGDASGATAGSCDPRVDPLSGELEPRVCSSCVAGGPGSTSCGYSTPLFSCNAACSSPYFSCCSAFGCKCCTG